MGLVAVSVHRLSQPSGSTNGGSAWLCRFSDPLTLFSAHEFQ